MKREDLNTIGFLLALRELRDGEEHTRENNAKIRCGAERIWRVRGPLVDGSVPFDADLPETPERKTRQPKTPETWTGESGNGGGGVSGEADDDTGDGALEYPPRKYLRVSDGSEGV